MSILDRYLAERKLASFVTKEEISVDKDIGHCIAKLSNSWKFRFVDQYTTTYNEIVKARGPAKAKQIALRIAQNILPVDEEYSEPEIDTTQVVKDTSEQANKAAVQALLTVMKDAKWVANGLSYVATLCAGDLESVPSNDIAHLLVSSQMPRG